ncbi:MAG: PA14 domain-containing protein [Anaerolineae bacterium]
MRTSSALSAMGSLCLFVLLLAVAGSPLHAQSAGAFTGEYYNNLDLSGAPAFIRQDPEINFNWGASAPDPAITTDSFSVRWTRWYNLDSAGPYSLTLTTDDGSRLWVDGNLVVDMWYDHGLLTRMATLTLAAGYHLVRVEYYNHGGSATAIMSLSFTGTYPDWKGEYFDNPDLTGAPVLVVNNPEINFNWGVNSPDPRIPADRFSARWTRSQYFDAGTYRFTLTTDDGSRVWVGDRLLIDQWRDQPPTAYTADMTLAAGTYPLRVEHYDRSGNASIQLSWATAPTSSVWNGQYFASQDLTGNPALTRKDADLAFNWGAAGPGSRISGDIFSAKWDSARTAPVAGFYTVYATVDDGVRVAVDGNRLIDAWRDQPPTNYAAVVYLAAGVHNWHVEYYQHLGGASLTVQIVTGIASTPLTTGNDINVQVGGAGWLAGSGTDWQKGQNGSASWVSSLNNAFTLPTYNWGRWYPALPAARSYEVLAYIPAGTATTRSAHYLIAHAGTVTFQTIPQTAYKDQWVSLGAYYFNGLGSEFVALADVTYECPRCYTVVWSSLKFSPR